MRSAATIIGLVVLLALGASPARAGEGEGDSPAEQAFRDAYWAETSRGALDDARDGYAKAADAEGPDAVRARALYRLAVVLERTGRTGEAIRALEKLAAAYPDQTELQAKARERLAEWTAVDLKTDFAEWYRRYLYSPEFQARIVEHVLALSAESKSGPATQELLTIGEPAVPALEAHLDSANEGMRHRVVDILVRMGKVPHPRHLLETSHWREQAANWSRLLALPSPQRAELRAQVEGTSAQAKTLRAVLGDRTEWSDAVLATPSSRLLDAILEQPMDPVLQHGLLGLVGRFSGDDAGFNRTLAWNLLERDLVPEETSRAWLVEGSRVLKEVVLEWIAKGRLRGEFYVDALLDLMEDTGSGGDLQSRIKHALARVLADTPLDAIDWDRLTRVYLGALGTYLQLPSAHFNDVWARTNPGLVRRFLMEIVERAADPRLAVNALNELSSSYRADPLFAPKLLAWVRDERLDPSLRERAARLLGETVTAETLDGTIDALERLPLAHAEALLLRLGNNPRIQALPWTDERLLRLMAWLRADGGRLRPQGHAFFHKLHEPRYRLENTVRLALREPSRAWGEALAEKRTEFRDAMRTIVGEEFPKQWETWTPEERADALRLFSSLLKGPGSDDLVPFFRRNLHAETTSPPVKKLLAAALPRGTASLDDVRAAYDLSDPEEALAAALTLYGRYPHTLETYEALKAARHAKDDEKRLHFWMLWLQRPENELERRAAIDMLEDPKVEHRKGALVSLAGVRTKSDIDLFAAALSDESPIVREEAAIHLARQWNPKAVAALVRALDDPDPVVRDQVLGTLEAIKKIEEQKEFWREQVRRGEIRNPK